VPDLWKYLNYAIIILILVAMGYFVIIDTNKQITEPQEADLKDNVAQNAQYPQLVAGAIGSNRQYSGRICPAGSAQFASSDANCNFCHKLGDAVINLSDATHHYAFIAGANGGGQMDNQTVEPFPNPAPPGYTVANPTLNPANSKFREKYLVEGHWIGLEVGPLTAALATANGIPSNVKGVLVDEVTLLSADSGILAGDVITAINNFEIGDLFAFKAATSPIAMSKEAIVTLFRAGTYNKIVVRSTEVLGIAQMEGAPMIRANSARPHSYYGPCENCHAISKRGRNTGQMAKDGGDILAKTAPPIRWGMKPPHANRGTCTNCHTIL